LKKLVFLAHVFFIPIHQVRSRLKKGKYSKQKLYKLDRQFTQAKAQGIGLGPEVAIRANPLKNNFLYPRQSKNQDTVVSYSHNKSYWNKYKMTAPGLY